MTLFEDRTRMAFPDGGGVRLMTSPRIVLPELPGCRSSVVVAPAAALLALPRAKSGAPAKPGCVVPLMVTGPAIPGRPEVRTIVFAPAGAMLKLMVSATSGVAFASSMAARRVGAPAG